MIGTLEPFIETYTGTKFYFLDPNPDDIRIEDIAHALSNNCRYTGHCRSFYSVAEHSIIVSILVDSPNALAGLLHDASEAYLTDVASPVKPYLTNYKHMEDVIMTAIATKYGFTWPLVDDVKDADAVQLKSEAKHLMPSGGKDWVAKYPTKREHGKVPKCLYPHLAEEAFLERFYELRNEKPISRSLIVAASR